MGYDSSGKPKHINGSIRDISKRRMAEEAMHESDFRLTRAEKVATIGNWKLMLNTQEMMASLGACIIYGVEKKQNDIGHCAKNSTRRIQARSEQSTI